MSTRRDDDPDAIDRAVHAFKSSAGTIRATALTEALLETEAAAKSRDAKGFAERFERIRSEYIATMSYLGLEMVGERTNA